MHISFDPNELSTTDKQVLALLAGGESAPSDTAAQAAAIAARVPAAAAKKTAAAPVVEPEPVEDLVGGETRTKEDAITLATEMVAAGNAAAVRAAIKEIGVAKVSDLEGNQVALFFAAVEA